MRKNLRTRAAELERRIIERADVVKQMLRDYRETQRAANAKGLQRQQARLLKKRNDVERANAEYLQLQKELDQLRTRIQAGK